MSEGRRAGRFGPGRALALPPPDSAAGVAVAITATLVAAFVVLLIAEYSALLGWAWWIASLALIVGAIGSFALATMVGDDISTFQRLDLDLAETIVSGTSGGSPPAPETTQAGVWRAYVTVADEARRVGRVHAYALGPFLLGTSLAVAAVLLTGLGLVTATSDIVGLALVILTASLAFLFIGGLALLLTVGYASPTEGFELLEPRRWRRNAQPLAAIDEALAAAPWLREFHRGTRDSRPADPPALMPAWLE